MRLLGGPDTRLRIAIVAVAVLAVVGVSLVTVAFAADLEEASPEPVTFQETVELGLSGETDEQMAGTATVPKAQVFYSQFQYVVGYHGIEALRSDLDAERTDEQLGYPIVVYVQDFGTDQLTLTEEGYLDPGAGVFLSWIPAEEAHYVVDSDARTPAGETIVPFESEADARSFADAHGGEVVTWEQLGSYEIEVATADLVREEVLDRDRRADRILDRSIERADRPTSVVVGEDEPTLQAAIDAAEPETTVEVPPGTYRAGDGFVGELEIDRPVTIEGTGEEPDAVRIVGDGNGSVVAANASDVALRNLAIAGTGNETRDEDAVPDDPDDSEWDTNIQLGYGHGDAAIEAVGVSGLHVEDVAIETNASGVLLRNSPDAVVYSTHVDGTDEWLDGFMGVVAIESPVVIDESSFVGGRDGAYVHRSDETVVRNSSFYGGRYGVHLMYSSDALIADNVAREQEFGGITVMTRPAGNAIVGNDVRDTSTGISASGIRTYIGHNLLADNSLGFSTSSRQSLYEHNVLSNNEMGVRATTVVPSSRIVGNDFVGNDRHASAGAGPLRIWAEEDRGNYWEGAYGTETAGGYDRAYSPSSSVDAILHREPGAKVLAEAPAVRGLREFLGTTPGMRAGSVIDPNPATEPFEPEIVAAARTDEPTRIDWRTQLDSGDAEATNESTTP